MGRKIDLIGQEFGRLMVVGAAESRNQKARWVVQCACGSDPKEVGADALLRGTTVSCGCHRQEFMASARSRQHEGTHQRSGAVEYETWRGMIRRCTDSGSPFWSRYGGRGITVCDRWVNSFDAFIADVGERPNAGMSIDRIDNDGNYEPGNVRWATARQQVHNSSAFKTGVSRWTKAELFTEVERLQTALLDAADRADDPDRMSMSRHDYHRLIDARDDAADRADAAEARVAELEATLRRVEALCGGPTSGGYQPYAVALRDDVILTVGLDDLRAALAPAQGETGVAG